ncbi:MAG: AraC family transcriptional regulator [Ruminococcaceae bacterium]|nr:AraC family transcriptional regulator [Oscillospiraceae bacterium]
MFYVEATPQITGLFTLFRQACSPDFVFHGESHNFWELVCVMEGRVRVAADEQVFELEAGQAILHPPMQFHNICSAGNTAPTFVVCTFTGEHIPPITNRVCRIPNMSDVKEMYELGRRSYDFYADIHFAGPHEGNQGHRLFLKELEALLLGLADQPSDTRQSATQSARNYTRIVSILGQQVPRRMTVAAMAKCCQMSEINLQKTFSRYAGVGIMEYYTRMCIRHATTLLKQGYSVKETAAQLGYADQNYFSTVFKRITGTTPSQALKEP